MLVGEKLRCVVVCRGNMKICARATTSTAADSQFTPAAAAAKRRKYYVSHGSRHTSIEVNEQNVYKSKMCFLSILSPLPPDPCVLFYCWANKRNKFLERWNVYTQESSLGKHEEGRSGVKNIYICYGVLVFEPIIFIKNQRPLAHTLKHRHQIRFRNSEKRCTFSLRCRSIQFYFIVPRGNNLHDGSVEFREHFSACKTS